MNNDIYWVWVQQALKYSNHKVRTIKRLYSDISEFYHGGEYEWRLCGCFTNREIKALNECTLDSAKEIVSQAYNLGYNIITLDDEAYPELLLQIFNPPCVLYAKGDVSLLNSDMPIAVVGTRKASMYGCSLARDMTKELVLGGATIISGGAIGIDSIAHETALDAGGKTIAVLGCGINYPYLPTNEWLRNKIAKKGLIISEYPPNYPVYSSNFPIRNRIISGLALGTLVVEAAQKSGSLITANFANEQNRDVFVAPMNSEISSSEGSMDLIRDGAQVVTSAKEILDEYNSRNKNIKPKKSNNYAVKDETEQTSLLTLSGKKDINYIKDDKKDALLLADVSENAKKIYEVLKNETMHIDDIALRVNLPVAKVLSAATELELIGLITSAPGRHYKASR